MTPRSGDFCRKPKPATRNPSGSRPLAGHDLPAYRLDSHPSNFTILSMFKDGLTKVNSFALGILLGSALVVPTVDARAHDPFPVILVDKATHSIAVASYMGDHMEIKKKYHVTLGKAQGDKQAEKDLKTPEGVYFLTAKLT